MSKQIEALKLALEALEIGHEYAVETAEHFHIEMAGYKQHRHDAMDAEVKQISDAITAIREALAEQRPQNCGTGYCSCIECPYEQPAQQQEQIVAWITNGSLYGLRRTNKKTVVVHREKTKVARIPVFIKVDA